jgi:hypothetical protein
MMLRTLMSSAVLAFLIAPLAAIGAESAVDLSGTYTVPANDDQPGVVAVTVTHNEDWTQYSFGWRHSAGQVVNSDLYVDGKSHALASGPDAEITETGANTSNGVSYTVVYHFPNDPKLDYRLMALYSLSDKGDLVWHADSYAPDGARIKTIDRTYKRQ